MNGRINTEKFKMGMVIIRQDSMVSQVVIVIAMVVSAVLDSTLSSGVLPRTSIAAPGSATCTTAIAMSTGTTTSTTSISRPVPLFVASGIDYLSI